MQKLCRFFCVWCLSGLLFVFDDAFVASDHEQKIESMVMLSGRCLCMYYVLEQTGQCDSPWKKAFHVCFSLRSDTVGCELAT